MWAKRWVLACILMVFLSLSLSLLNARVMVADAKPSMILNMVKDHGFAAFARINGQFTLTAIVSKDVTRVEFYLDNTIQANDTKAPFSWSFNTSNYTLGNHIIKAVGYTPAGEEASAQIIRNFIKFPLFFVIGVTITFLVSISVCIFYLLKKIRF